jgi:hypothetical protein
MLHGAISLGWMDGGNFGCAKKSQSLCIWWRCPASQLLRKCSATEQNGRESILSTAEPRIHRIVICLSRSLSTMLSSQGYYQIMIASGCRSEMFGETAVITLALQLQCLAPQDFLAVKRMVSTSLAHRPPSDYVGGCAVRA